MTGNIREGLGLLVAAAVAVLLALLLRGTEMSELLWLGAVVLVLVGLVRLATGLFRNDEA